MKPSDCPITEDCVVSPQLFRHPKVRIDVPAVLLADLLDQSRARESLAPSLARLVSDYSGAQGYVDRWGHVLERSVGPFVVLTFVPVLIWESTTAPRRRAAPPIRVLSARAHDAALPALKRSLPRGAQVTGGAISGRRHPSALFGLVLAEADVPEFQRWAELTLLPELLPEVLARARAEITSAIEREGSPHFAKQVES